MTTKISVDNLDATITTLIGSGGGPKATAITYPGNDLAADPAGSQTIAITGTGFVAGCNIFVGTVQATVVTVVSATSVTFTSPALAAGTYTLYVVNPDGGTATIVPGVSYSGIPAWTTGAGSLGTAYEYAAISNTVAATGDGSITYSVFSGTLPTGSTLNTSSGTITGTSPASAGATTYSFVIRATDAQLQDTDRSFSITVNTDVVTWTTPAANSVTTLAKDTASTTTLLATSAAGRAITYTANALPTGLSISGAAVTGTPTVVASTTSTFTATAATTGKTATATINWTVSVASDTYFPYTTLLLSGSTSTATFVTDASTNNFSVAIVGDTKPNNFNPLTPGYYSNYFDGTGDYLTTATNAAFAFGTGDYTFECWINTNSTAQQVLFGSGGTGTNNFYFNFVPASSFIGVGTQLAYVLQATSISLLTGVWYHVAASRSSGTLKLFLNGSQVASGADSTTWIQGGSPAIGSNAASGQYTNGYISNLRVLKGTAVYTTAFTPSTTPLTAIANTSLLTCQSNRFIDNSTNLFTITKYGDTTVSPTNPFVPNTAYAAYGSTYFSGASSTWLAVPINATFAFGTNNYTYEAWVYPTAFPNAYNTVFCNFRDDEGAKGWSLLITSTGLIHVNNQGTYNNSTTAISLNTWTHIAVCRVGNTVTRYINGVADPTTLTVTASITNVAAHGPTIGGSPEYSTAREWSGYISSARVVSGTAVYTSAFTPPTAPLTAVTNTSLLTLQTNQPVNNSMFLDSSTNAFAVTRAGNTTQGTFSPYGANWSNYFDGTGDYLSVPATSQFAFGTGNFTIEAWIYLNAYGSSIAGPQMFGTTNGQETGYSINVGQSANSFRIISNATGVWADNLVVSAGGGPSLNTWTHMCVVRQGANLTIYKNGVSVASTASATTWNFIGTTGIIGRFSDATFIRDFPGYISNLRVNSTAVYTTAFTPSTTPLTAIANTSLLTCQSNRFIDNSTNAFAITAAGDVAVQRFSPFSPQTQTAITHSAYFDGSGDYLTSPANTAFAFAKGDLTVQMWIYPTATITTPANIGLFYIEEVNGLVVGLSNGYIAMGLRTIAYNLTSTYIPLVNTWTHIAVTRSGATAWIFANGIQVGTVTAASGDPNNNANYVCTTGLPTIAGNYAGGAGFGYFPGYISNIQVVKGTAVYTSAFTPPSTPLTATQAAGTNIAAVTGTQTSLLTLQSPTFVDNSTNGFAITAVGDTKPRTVNPFGFTNTAEAYSAATYGGSAYFDGTGDYLNSPSSSLFNLYGINWTVEGWFNLVSATSDDRLFVFAGASVSWGFYRRAATGNIYFGQMGTDEVLLGNMLLNEWTHLALVRTSGPTISLYKNGVFSASTAAYSMPNENCTFLIAGNPAPYSNTVTKGYVSNVRVVKGTAVYTSNFVPPSAPLTAITNTSLLLNMTSAGIYDSASMNNLETVGDAKISTAQSKFGGSSMYFDGNGDYLAVSPNITSNLGTGNFTIEAWVYLTSASTYQFLMGSSANGGMMVGFSVPLSPTATIAVGTHNVTWFLNFGASITISSNTWTHVAITRSGSSNQAFINGVQLGPTITDSTNWSFSNNAPYIGTNALSNYLNGYVNDLRITKGYVRYTVYSATTSNTTASSIRSGSSLAGFFGSYGIFNTTAAGQYLLVDFGVSVSNIQTTYLNYNGGQWAPTSVLIQTSNDNSTWSTVVTYSDNNTNTLQTIASTGSGRYWRIYQNSATRQNSAGYEWHLGSFTMTNSFTPTTAFIAR